MSNPMRCPNPLCQGIEEAERTDSSVSSERDGEAGDSVWYRTLGSYQTLSFGVVMRYQCRKCKLSFSSRTLSRQEQKKRLINVHSIYQLCVQAFRYSEEQVRSGKDAAYTAMTMGQSGDHGEKDSARH